MKDIYNIKIISFIHSLFISIEFLYALILFIIYKLEYRFFEEIGEFLFSTNDIIMTVSIGLPIAILSLGLKLNIKIIQPNNDNKVLFEWKRYEEYKISSYVGLLYNAIPIIPVFMCWVYKDVYYIRQIGITYIILVGMSIISIGTMYFAHLKVKEVIGKNE